MDNKAIANVGIVVFSIMLVAGLFVQLGGAKAVGMAEDTYYLEMNVASIEGGTPSGASVGHVTIEGSNQGDWIESGKVVSIWATPFGDGVVFDHWEGGVEDPKSKHTSFTMPAHRKVITAYFEVVDESLTHSLELNWTTGGIAEAVPYSGSSYEDGEKVELYANPNLGYEFNHWEGDVSDPNSRVTHTIMNSDKTIKAVFSESVGQYYVNVDWTDGGTVRPKGGKLGPYEKGESATLTADPTSGYVFSRWKGDISGTKKEVTFSVESDMDVTAVFSKEETVKLSYGTEPDTVGEIEVTPLNGENVAQALETKILAQGTEVRLTATEDSPNYVFDHWTMNGSNYSGSVQVTITLTQDTDMVAHFVEEEPGEATLSVRVEGQGTVNRVSAQALDLRKQFTVEKGETIGLRALADEGYSFDEWTGARNSTNREVDVLMDSDKTITAHFQEEVPITEKATEPSALATIIGSIGLIGSIGGRFLL